MGGRRAGEDSFDDIALHDSYSQMDAQAWNGAPLSPLPPFTGKFRGRVVFFITAFDHGATAFGPIASVCG